MSLIINIPKGDLAKGIPISEGWKLFSLTETFPKPSKDQGSINYYVHHKLIDDANERTIEHNFNSKALGMMAPFIAALQNKTQQEVLDSMESGDLSFDLQQVVGQKILGKVEHSTYQGRIQSKIVDWAHPDNTPTF
jgi:hypothetical protein